MKTTALKISLLISIEIKTQQIINQQMGVMKFHKSIELRINDISHGLLMTKIQNKTIVRRRT